MLPTELTNKLLIHESALLSGYSVMFSPDRLATKITSSSGECDVNGLGETHADLTLPTNTVTV